MWITPTGRNTEAMTILKSVLLFTLAAAAEIGGAWLIWQSVREDRAWWWAGLGVVALGVYGFVAAFQPDANFGRVLAAYGGVFIAGSLAWGVVLDGFRPDRWDLIGAARVPDRRGRDHVRPAPGLSCAGLTVARRETAKPPVRRAWAAGRTGGLHGGAETAGDELTTPVRSPRRRFQLRERLCRPGRPRLRPCGSATRRYPRRRRPARGTAGAIHGWSPGSSCR